VMKLIRIFLAIILVTSVIHAAEKPVPDAAKPLLGCWKGDVGNSLMKFEAVRVICYDEGQLYVFAATYEAGAVTLSHLGSKFTAKAEITGDKLTWTTSEGHGQILTRLANVPDELELKSLPLGPSKPIPAEKLKDIQQELAKRQGEDQAVRKDKAREKDMGAVDRDNTTYLTKLVGEVGWIDVTRFGAPASHDAFLIVQHSGKLPLMLAALPEIEKDTKAGQLTDGQNFALLYDRTKLYMGEKQRYGTQVGQDAKGDPVVLPLEDRKKVEQYRKEINLSPLPQYLEMFEKQFGKKVKFMD
jgi:hypothetical protein